jgi:hypothetical protein
MILNYTLYQRMRCNFYVIPNHCPDIDRAVDAELHIVPHDRTKLLLSGATASRLYDAMVMAQVCDLGPRTEITMPPYHTVTDIVEMGNPGVLHNDRVLQLRGMADVAPVTYG